MVVYQWIFGKVNANTSIFQNKMKQDDYSLYVNFLAAIGAFTLFVKLFDTFWNYLQIIRSLLLPYFIPDELHTLKIKFGSWALITGSTDGIGKEYAKQLARRGINIILVSRNQEKLEATAEEIETKYSVKTKIIAVDFATGPKAIEIVEKELEQLPPIGILVNNVGKQYSYPMYLEEVPEQELWDIININIGAVTMMTRLIIKRMKEQGRGAIVNISSGAELQPLPLMNVYAASKVYNKFFTEALRQEYSKHGLTIQHISPFFVNTKMNTFSNSLQRTSILVPNAAMVAKYAVHFLGKLDHTTGFWFHGIQYFVTSLVPMWIRMQLGDRLNHHLRKEYFSLKAKN